MLYNIVNSVRLKNPLVHNITNYVTVNDCANILLACGASPIMADDKEEVEEITGIADSLVINMGTLNRRTVESMILAGKKANELSKPVVFDPVGAGASAFRTNTALQLLNQIKFTVIRGNGSEIQTLCYGFGDTRGVDASNDSANNGKNIKSMIDKAKMLSVKTGAVVVVTGSTDIVTDGEKTYLLGNGHSSMSKITGTGCMLTALIGAFCGVSAQPLLGAAAAVLLMGQSGEKAYEKMIHMDGGTSSLKMYLIDAVSKMTEVSIKEGAKVEIR